MKQQDFTGRWMPEGGDLDGLYLGELYNSHAWDCYAKDDDWEYQDWHVPNREEQAPSSIAPVKAHYSQSVDDRSAPDPIRLMVPSPLLVREAGLRWNGEPGEWTTGEELVVKDPDIRSGWTGTLLVRRDFLDDFLQTQGYTLVWAVVGEKLVYNWDERYPRLEISGSCHYSKTGVECKMQSRYSGRDEVGGSDQEGATYT